MGRWRGMYEPVWVKWQLCSVVVSQPQCFIPPPPPTPRGIYWMPRVLWARFVEHENWGWGTRQVLRAHYSEPMSTVYVTGDEPGWLIPRIWIWLYSVPSLSLIIKLLIFWSVPVYKRGQTHWKYVSRKRLNWKILMWRKQTFFWH
jgi:hypothetical protein